MNELYHIDKLDKSDYYRGFLQLLEQLTTVDSDNISYEDFCNQCDNINSIIFVVRNLTKNQIIASGSIYIEKKFIHKLGSTGHIEDIVVNKEYRGKGFGKAIVTKLSEYAKKVGCYKVILNCSEKNIPFYEKCSFKAKEYVMASYFN
jgi:glucosamine-phosphate N-acetyltransferase